MSNDIVAPSEAALYAVMVLNVLGVLGALIWAWRRGHFSDLERAAAVALADDDGDGGGGGYDDDGRARSDEARRATEARS